MRREDGRTIDQLRPITIVYERLDRVDGSARFGFGTVSFVAFFIPLLTHYHGTGQTQTIASVSGPIEVRANLESPSQATLDIHIRPLASVPGTDSRAFANILKTILTPALLLSNHPRSLVQLVGQALCGSESGSGSGTVGRGWNFSIMASLINACNAAFVNAGSVPMRGIVCAVAVGRLPDTGNENACILILDPSENELPQLQGGGCFAFLFSSTINKDEPEGNSLGISLVWRNYATSDGTFDEIEFERAQSLARKGAQEIWHTVKASLPGNMAALQLSAGSEKQLARPNPHTDILDDAKMEI
jgi:exosome complex component RRP46